MVVGTDVTRFILVLADNADGISATKNATLHKDKTTSCQINTLIHNPALALLRAHARAQVAQDRFHRNRNLQVVV